MKSDKKNTPYIYRKKKRITSNSQKPYKQKREQSKIFKALREKTHQLKVCTLQIYPFRVKKK